MRDLAPVFKALGDETRLAIMALIIRRGDLCVCDFEAVLGISQSKSSRHLRYLLNAGLVENRREGVWMHYRIPRKADARTRAVISSLRPILAGGELERLGERLDAWLARKKRRAVCR